MGENGGPEILLKRILSPYTNPKDDTLLEESDCTG